MSLRVYSTLTKTKEPFQTVKPGEVGMYLCGPTVYKPPHIGHLVGPVIFDAVKRYLVYKGFKVTWVVNITDVDDKLIQQAAEENTTVETIARRCTNDYLAALRDLGIDQVDHFPRATDHIQNIIDLCRTLMDKGFAYATDGNVWFDVSKDHDYGKLSNRTTEEQEGGRDLEGAGKRNRADFALWKAVKPGEVAWPSPWGQGRPGWHIECSAMAMKLLGETFDIHGGGMDLLFPHHENEIAQSECATGKPLARYWMHNGLTRVRTKAASGEWKAEKMSKSLGNVISARELLNEYGPEVLRYFLLSTHYRSPIEFTDKALSDATKGYQSISRAFARAERVAGKAIEPDFGVLLKSTVPLHARILDLAREFEAAMDDDFNTAGAISTLHQMASELNKAPETTDLVAATAYIKGLARTTLGLFQFAPTTAGGGDDELANKLMQLIITLRADARKTKNYAIADQIRKALDEAGVVLEDKPDGTLWRRK